MFRLSRSRSSGAPPGGAALRLCSSSCALMRQKNTVVRPPTSAGEVDREARSRDERVGGAAARRHLRDRVEQHGDQQQERPADEAV